MKIKDIYFMKSARSFKDFPNLAYPEFAFMGRSNVGKSSLINMIMSKKDLVKVGAKPGVTRTINFFILNNSITLADLPGYGYAKLPAEIKNSFLPLMKDYISRRDRLKLVFLLMDIRRTPDELEKNMIMHLTEHRIPIAVIATKCDKFSRNQKIMHIKKIAEALMIGIDSIFLTSIKTGEGKKELLHLIDEYLKQ